MANTGVNVDEEMARLLELQECLFGQCPHHSAVQDLMSSCWNL